MKIKVKKARYEQVLKQVKATHSDPVKPSFFLRKLTQLLSARELKKVHFSYQTSGMEQLSISEPCLILMNHSSFIDLKIAATIFHDRPFHIVCTSDGFVGKDWLMKRLGCIPTQKFVTDVTLLRDIKYALTKLGSSILMYPEASYSFDGTSTPLPESVGKCLKLFRVPVIMVKTYGAFSRDPLYNGLQLRDVKVSATVTYLLSAADCQEKSVSELNAILKEAFTFDSFKWQQENHVKIKEPFRADYLNRVLYKCPHCQVEGAMLGKGTRLTCTSCHTAYELTEYGELICLNQKAKFSHVPDWYQWERECVRKELLAGTYELKTEVAIYLLADHKQLYSIGDGVLQHHLNGFTLDGCNGALHFEKKPESSYSLYADYYWYEMGDMICIGDAKELFYCFPKDQKDIVAKARLATEELYKIVKGGK